ncbi:transglutaminase superfamily protein [Serinibacter salmoneus]|uniref:Transglutaminase superfamily protein n=1 Tax=Serinibacter salmoneus TaxID=556530 RepID=A0A2A9D3R4_9MICO|nr:transglutaminase superfamily protein [Serinibacter salmoneus]
MDDVGWRLGDLAEGSGPGHGRAPYRHARRLQRRGDPAAVDRDRPLTPHLPVPDSTQALATEVEGWAHDESLRCGTRATPSIPGPTGWWSPASAPRPRRSPRTPRAPTRRTPAWMRCTRRWWRSPNRSPRARRPTSLAPWPCQQWFTDTGGFTYSLSVADGSTGNRLLDFLERKVGYCEQYASAMAVMLRSLGIPARVVVGYSAGTTNADGVTEIYSTNAHAWVEVEFDDAGWSASTRRPLTARTCGNRASGPGRPCWARAGPRPREQPGGRGPGGTRRRDLGAGRPAHRNRPRMRVLRRRTSRRGPQRRMSSRGRASLLPLVAAMLGAAILALAPNAAREMVRRRRLVRMREAGPAAAMRRRGRRSRRSPGPRARPAGERFRAADRPRGRDGGPGGPVDPGEPGRPSWRGWNAPGTPRPPPVGRTGRTCERRAREQPGAGGRRSGGTRAVRRPAPARP